MPSLEPDPRQKHERPRLVVPRVAHGGKIEIREPVYVPALHGESAEHAELHSGADHSGVGDLRTAGRARAAAESCIALHFKRPLRSGERERRDDRIRNRDPEVDWHVDVAELLRRTRDGAREPALRVQSVNAETENATGFRADS